MNHLYVKVEIMVPLNNKEEACEILLDRLREVRKTLKPKQHRRRTRKHVPVKCTFAGCNRPHRARGMCIDHYNQWRKQNLDPITGNLKGVKGVGDGVSN
jgi:hypothetical protein